MAEDRCTVSQMADVIMEGLEEYAQLAADDMKKAVKKAGTQARKDIQENAPVKTGAEKHFTFESYLNDSISYHTGKYTGAEVIDATEDGHSGTLGKHGYFKRTEEAVPEILEKALSQL